MPVWFGLLIAFISSLTMNFGLTLQKRRASELPKIGKERGALVARAFFSNRDWWSGTIVLLLGWGLYLWSMQIAPISLVQPTLGMGLMAMALFSVFYLKEKIKPGEWVIIAGMFIGFILLGLSAREEMPKELPSIIRLLIATAFILALALFAYFLGKKGKLNAIRADTLLGIVAGLFLGLGAVFARSMFLFSGHQKDFNALGIFLPAMVISYLLGIVIIQSGFQHGKALIVVVMESVISKLVAILAGIFALNESLPQNRTLAVMRIIAFVLILFGSGVLARFGKEK